MWDRWPTEAELQELRILTPERLDQWGNYYKELTSPPEMRAICTCCGAEFTEGYYTYAPQDRTLYRLLVCVAHVQP